MDIEICKKQAIRHEMMAKKYNDSHLVYTFEVGEIVTIAIPSKDRAVNDPPQMEAKVIAIPHENRYRLQTQYGVLTNSYPTNELNLVPAELGFCSSTVGYIKKFICDNYTPCGCSSEISCFLVACQVWM